MPSPTMSPFYAAVAKMPKDQRRIFVERLHEPYRSRIRTAIAGLLGEPSVPAGPKRSPTGQNRAREGQSQA